ncbi:MAG: hypothetical protein QGD94_09900, partial [Planctomycetia bacterium]|nr:hypothetical protein [Planctomycetia bacterium]
MGIGILQIGYKGIGRGWCKTIQGTPNCRLVGVVDPDDEARQLAAPETGACAFGSVAEAKAS